MSTAKTEKPSEAVQPVATEVPAALFTDTLKIALYGRFGSRKTLQIASLIDLVGQDSVLVVSAEHGLNTIRSRVNAKNVVVAASIPDMRTAWAAARKFAGPDKWVCIDGMSQVTEWISNAQLSMADRYYEANQLGKTPERDDLPAGKYIQKGEINTMAIYGKVGRDSEGLLSSWIGLPVNLYCNYLEDMTGSNKFEKTIPWGPDVPGRVGLKAVMSSFDYVGRITVKDDDTVTVGFDSASNFYMARTREDRTVVRIPKEIPNFNLADFVKLVQGKEVADAKAG